MGDNIICVFKATRVNFVSITTKIDWFNTPSIIVRDDGIKLTFKKPTIDYGGRTTSPNLTNSGWITFVIKSDIPINRYKISDESDEDSIIIYYKLSPSGTR